MLSRFKTNRLFFILPILFFQLACAQQKKVISKTYAFYTERLPGNVPVDPETGQVTVRRDTIITVYTETRTKNIQWDTAWNSSGAWLIRSSIIDKASYEAGMTKLDNKKIVLQPAAGSVLWQLSFEPLSRNRAEPPAIPSPGTMILSGRADGKRFVQQTGAAVELAGIPSY